MCVCVYVCVRGRALALWALCALSFLFLPGTNEPTNPGRLTFLFRWSLSRNLSQSISPSPQCSFLFSPSRSRCRHFLSFPPPLLSPLSPFPTIPLK
ncbi:hypothetical protein B0J12DRAFT_164644 [Macrophomina phaseolina]|uniref:Secreted protein n=1 Tax=Macrophomina phaseolina TaxID=35725 RepID=A0ABQ8GS11_9PEZI|nr:hypothetical protein B0J12DRAFT_164644 [Macrophomina phaseolina]